MASTASHWKSHDMGMNHLSAWGRIALVSDHEMINTFGRSKKMNLGKIIIIKLLYYEG